MMPNNILVYLVKKVLFGLQNVQNDIVVFIMMAMLAF